MARLPDAQALGERPTPQPSGAVASFQLSRDTLDQSLTMAGRDLERANAIVEETNRRQDTIAAEAALNKLQEQRVTLEFDQKGGFRNVKEGGALGQQFVDGYMGRFNDAAAAIADGLQNEQQKALFKQRMPVVGLQYRSSLLQHQSHQTDAFNEATEQGVFAAELQNIAQHPDNDLTFRTAVLRIEETVAQAGVRKGLPAEAVAAAKARHLDAAYASRIYALTDGVVGVMEPDPYRAQALFKDAQGKLSADAQIKLAHHVNGAVTRANETTAMIAIQKDAPGVFQITSQALGLGQGEERAAASGADDEMRVPPAVQVQRDAERLQILTAEANDQSQPEDVRAAVRREIDRTRASMAQLSALARLNPQPDPPFAGPPAPVGDTFTNQRVKTGLDFIDNAQTVQLLHWRQQAHTEMQRGQATDRSALKERVQNLHAMVLSAVEPPLESIPAVAEFTRAFGAEGLQRYSQDVADYVRIGAGIKALQIASGDERKQLLKRFEPPAGDEFGHRQKLHGALVEAGQIIEKQIATDPAAYAMKHAPKVQEAQAAMMQVLGDKNASETDRRAAVSDYANATLAEQQRLGVQGIRADVLGEGAKKRQLAPRLLTNGQANGIAAQFASTPANAAQLMEGLQQQWGSYFPQVYGQLAQDEKLPPAALVIPNMSDPFSKEFLARMSDPEAQKGIDEKMAPADKTALNSKLLSFNESFYNSLAFQDGGQKTYNTVIDQQRILAMGYMAQGKSVGDAAKLAYEQTVGHGYQFEGSLRIPKTQQPDLVLAGTRAILNQSDRLDVQVPPSFRVGLKDAARRAAWIDAVRAGGTFIATGDEGGVTLYTRAKNDTGADALFAVRSADGAPMTWSWSQLRGVYADQPGAAASDDALQKALAKGDRETVDRILRDRAAQRKKDRGQ